MLPGVSQPQTRVLEFVPELSGVEVASSVRRGSIAEREVLLCGIQLAVALLREPLYDGTGSKVTRPIEALRGQEGK